MRRLQHVCRRTPLHYKSSIPPARLTFAFIDCCISKVLCWRHLIVSAKYRLPASAAVRHTPLLPFSFYLRSTSSGLEDRKKCKRFTAAALRSQFSMWKNYGKIFKAAVPTTGFSHTHPAALTVTKFVLALTCRIFTAVLVPSEFMQKSTSAAAAVCQNPRILSIFYKYKT